MAWLGLLSKLSRGLLAGCRSGESGYMAMGGWAEVGVTDGLLKVFSVVTTPDLTSARCGI